MYKTKLISKKEVAEATILFEFEKPTGFTYKAGQSVDLTIPNMERMDSKGNTYAFSLSSAPFEETLYITTRMRDSVFKNTLKNIDKGGELSIEGPFGDLILHENIKRTAVFLAGGIGVTPFYSMIKEASKTKLPHKIFLFYSNRRPEDTAFLGELRSLEKENPNFKLVATMTDMTGSNFPWCEETGYIDEKMISKYVPQYSKALYYLAGPATMAKGLRSLLNTMGISNDDIRSEEFTGY